MTHEDHIQEAREAKRRVRNKILALGRSVNMQLPTSPAEQRMEEWRVNNNHVNAWILEHGTVKKTIERMTLSELNATCTQFDKVCKSIRASTYK